MDPFFEMFQDLLEQDNSIEEALAEIQAFIQEPENTTMLRELSSTGDGRELLIEWRKLWDGYGLRAPWENIVRA